MSMDRTYQAMHQTAEGLRFHVQDALDEPSDPSAQVLMQEAKELLNDLELQKKPRTIEDRIKLILDLLHRARSEGQAFMSVGDAVTFFDRYEDLRREIRGHVHYS